MNAAPLRLYAAEWVAVPVRNIRRRQSAEPRASAPSRNQSSDSAFGVRYLMEPCLAVMVVDGGMWVVC